MKRFLIFGLIIALVFMFSLPVFLFANGWTEATVTVHKSTDGNFSSGTFNFDLQRKDGNNWLHMEYGSISHSGGDYTFTISEDPGSNTFRVVEYNVNGGTLLASLQNLKSNWEKIIF